MSLAPELPNPQYELSAEDLRGAIHDAKKGAIHAVNQLVTYLQPHVESFLERRMDRYAQQGDERKIEAISRAGEAIAVVLYKLEEFDHEEETETLPLRFGAWAKNIARSIYHRDQRYENSQPPIQVSLDKNDYFHEIIPDTKEPEQVDTADDDIAAALDQALATLFPQDQLKIVRLKLQGKTIQQIEQEEKIPREVISKQINLAKEKIDQLMRNARFIPVVRADQKHIRWAAYHGQLKATRIFGTWYTLPEWISIYEHTRRTIVDQDMINNGYLLLTDVTTPRECSTLRSNQYNLKKYKLILHKNRIYIHNDMLQKFLSERKPAPLPRVEGAPPGFTRLSDLLFETEDESFFDREIKGGRFRTIQLGRWQLSTQADVDAYLESLLPPPPRQLVRLGNFAAFGEDKDILWHAIMDGILPAVRHGRMWYVSPDDMENYFSTHPLLPNLVQISQYAKDEHHYNRLIFSAKKNKFPGFNINGTWYSSRLQIEKFIADCEPTDKNLVRITDLVGDNNASRQKLERAVRLGRLPHENRQGQIFIDPKLADKFLLTTLKPITEFVDEETGYDVIHNAVKNGSLPSERNGKLYVVNPKDVAKWKETRKKK